MTTDPDLLPNEGSTARDHLANERTLLAWVRTGLGIIGLGVVLEKLVDLSAYSTIAGATLILYGVGMLAYALVRFQRVQRALRSGQFPIARRGPVLIGLLGLVVAVGALILLLAA